MQTQWLPCTKPVLITPAHPQLPPPRLLSSDAKDMCCVVFQRLRTKGKGVIPLCKSQADQWGKHTFMGYIKPYWFEWWWTLTLRRAASHTLGPFCDGSPVSGLVWTLSPLMLPDMTLRVATETATLCFSGHATPCLHQLLQRSDLMKNWSCSTSFFEVGFLRFSRDIPFTSSLCSMVHCTD